MDSMNRDGASRAFRRGVMAATAATAAGWIGARAMRTSATPELPAALAAERRETVRRAGRLSYYAAGSGTPLLLVHSINAAASAYEVKPIFEHAVAKHWVYAPDLPGFGFSDRSDRSYGMRLYVDAIHDMLDVIAAEHGRTPVDVLAVSLSSEFAARAAVEAPDRFRSLALVTPTGFSRGSDRLRGEDGATREVPGVYKTLNGLPFLGRGLYDLLVTRASIRYFLQRTFGSKAIDEGLLDYDYLTAHQPGAANAPFAFLSARLFAKDIRKIYERLTLPVWVPHATRGDFKDFSDAGWAEARPNWTFEAYPTGALPHFEQPEAFLASFDRFLADAQEVPAYSSGSEVRSPSP